MSLIFGTIEFHNHAMIMESSSSHDLNLGPSSTRASLIKWLAFPFP